MKATEELRQRIHYLVQHGGVYPEPECDKIPRAQRAVPWLVGAVLICLIIELILHLR